MERKTYIIFALIIHLLVSHTTHAEEQVAFTLGQMATIILPEEPDAGKGKYYRLDRWENEQIVFEEEIHPQANIPYVIVPKEDFSIDLSNLDVKELLCDTAKIDGVHFVGTYVERNLGCRDAYRYYLIDTTPDCYREEDRAFLVVGAMRAFLEISYDKCYKWKQMEVVFHDISTPVDEVSDCSLNGGQMYDLFGRQIPGKAKSGIYIKDGRKVVTK